MKERTNERVSERASVILITSMYAFDDRSSGSLRVARVSLLSFSAQEEEEEEEDLYQWQWHCRQAGKQKEP